MQHSIAARYAAWPARFVHPSHRARERRLGLRAGPAFTAAPARRTVLRRPDVGPADRAARPVARADRRAAAPVAQRSPEARVRDVLDELDAGRRAATALRGAGVARLKQAVATSAGGIVIRFVDGAPQLVVGKRRRERDGVTWTLPKGTPNPSETTEETALREVREETGLEVRIVRRSTPSSTAFVQGRTRIHKTVHYFLMVPDGRGPGAPRPRVRRGPLDRVRRGRRRS